jgi:ketosteroid isomerase-like protein
MSQENVEIVRTMWAAWGRGDFPTARGMFAEDSVWDDTRFRPDGAVHHGLGALDVVSSTWRQTWERYSIEAERVLDAGDEEVAVVVRDRGEGRGGGVAVTNHWGVVMTVRDRRIVHTKVYPTPEQVLEAAGLRQSAS